MVGRRKITAVLELLWGAEFKFGEPRPFGKEAAYQVVVD